MYKMVRPLGMFRVRRLRGVTVGEAHTQDTDGEAAKRVRCLPRYALRCFAQRRAVIPVTTVHIRVRLCPKSWRTGVAASASKRVGKYCL